MISVAGDASAPCRGPSRRTVLLSSLGLFSASANPARSATMKHVALLGDSVFDNAAYVGSGPDVARQLRSLAQGFEVTLLARDGATIAEIHSQTQSIDRAISHVLVSIGGNDALRASGV